MEELLASIVQEVFAINSCWEGDFSEPTKIVRECNFFEPCAIFIARVISLVRSSVSVMILMT
jgi:hypothetical protein